MYHTVVLCWLLIVSVVPLYPALNFFSELVADDRQLPL